MDDQRTYPIVPVIVGIAAVGVGVLFGPRAAVHWVLIPSVVLYAALVVLIGIPFVRITRMLASATLSVDDPTAFDPSERAESMMEFARSTGFTPKVVVRLSKPVMVEQVWVTPDRTRSLAIRDDGVATLSSRFGDGISLSTWVDVSASIWPAPLCHFNQCFPRAGIETLHARHESAIDYIYDRLGLKPQAAPDDIGPRIRDEFARAHRHLRSTRLLAVRFPLWVMMATLRQNRTVEQQRPRLSQQDLPRIRAASQAYEAL